MISRQLIRTDLNLLVALQALLEERNVTRAAERLFVTQPALSKTLQRLRDTFDDPLFHRSSYGLVPTPKAELLAEQLPDVLAALESVLGDTDFDPKDYRGEFTLALPALAAACVMPELIQRLQEQAPYVRVHCQAPEGNFVEQLSSGQIDYALHKVADYPAAVDYDVLGQLTAKVYMRPEHPLAGQSELSAEQATSYSHIHMHVPGLSRYQLGLVDERFQELGLTRHVMLSTDQLHAALRTVKKTDCLMISSSILSELDEAKSLVSAQLPEDLFEESLKFGLFWHRRVRDHASHKWFKTLLLESFVAAMPDAKT